MARPISHDPSRSHYPAIEELEFNTRNDVPVTPCTVLSALVKIIANYVTALFQYIASFFTQSASASTPVSATDSSDYDSSRDDIEFLHTLFREHAYKAKDFRPSERRELLTDIARILVYELVIGDRRWLLPIPPFVNTESLENSIEALRRCYNQLDDFDKRYARNKFNDKYTNTLTLINPAGDLFVQHSDAFVERLCNNHDFVGFVNRAMNNFRG